ncbi:RNA-binding protein 41-like isoform X2 [Gigantopelta aegis]|nr:RNA-binding protein 41-like isoform X2 [Gigantopelta aegis]
MGLSTKKGNLQADEVLETEGERHLQTLVRKQLNTDITLKQQLAQHISFKKAGEYDPEIRSLSGVTPLTDYKSVDSRDVYIEELKQCGLTNDEIELKLGLESQGNSCKQTNKSKYGINPQIQEERLQKVDLKITENRKQLSKPDTFSGVVHLGRHHMELEKSLVNINKDTKTISNALIREKQHVIGDPNDPINQLPDILRDVQKKAKLEGIKRRKRSHGPCCHDKGISADPDHTERPSEFVGPLLPDYDNLENDITGSGDTEPSTLNKDVSYSHTQANQECATVSADQDNATQHLNRALPGHTSLNSKLDDSIDTNCDVGGPRQLKTEVEFVPETVIKKYRLTECGIRNLPRFKNFSTGDPSNVLYLKNLSSMVTEEDLVSLFGRFQNPRSSTLIYKLMTGRMRGQAFVTFPDTPTAESALQLINGYHFKGKPIIIQYGKKV